MAARMTDNNIKIFEQAKRSLVGGVDSPVRSFSYVGGDPILVERGRGSKVYDYNGNEYIDYVLSWGAAILGHAHPAVIRAVRRAAGRGLSFGTTNAPEVALAQKIRERIGWIDKIRFVNSGTEAVMGAVRLARGYIKRDTIVKFEHAYHGHADYLLAKAGSGLATLNIPSSAGVPKDYIKHTIVAPLGDEAYIERLFARRGSSIAAVIVEPVGANYGVIAPDTGFLKLLRRLTKRYGALLIFDEVITGFRFSFGSIGQEFGITPDLICLGKIIGGGLPIGAYGGSNTIMKHLAPSGDVYQASTFSGNPVVMEAGLATVRAIARSRRGYDRLMELAGYLSASLEKEAALRDIYLKATWFGTIFSIRCRNRAIFKRFYRQMLARGVYLAPSEFEANFISFAHSEKDIDKTIACAKSALNKIRKERTR